MNQSDSLLIMRQVARIEELGSQVNELTESNRQLREALAAAKEALTMCLELEGTSSMSYDPDEYNGAITSALALIAECEKELK